MDSEKMEEMYADFARRHNKQHLTWKSLTESSKKSMQRFEALETTISQLQERLINLDTVKRDVEDLKTRLTKLENATTNPAKESSHEVQLKILNERMELLKETSNAEVNSLQTQNTKIL